MDCAGRSRGLRGDRGSSARRCAVAGLVIALASAALVWLVHSPLADAWLAARVATVLGPSVRFSAAEFALWPPPLAVALDGVELLADDGSVAARATRVRCRLRLRALVTDTPALAAVRVDGLTASIIRTAEGRIRVGSHSVPHRIGSAPSRDLDAQLPEIVVHGAALTVRAESAAAARILHLTELRADAEPLHPGARIAAVAHSPELGRVRALLTLGRLHDIHSAPLRLELEATEVSAAALQAWAPIDLGVASAGGGARLTVAVDGQLAAGAATWTVEMADGALTWRGLSARAPFHVAARGAWANGSLASLTATLDAGHLEYAPIAASAFHASLALENGTPVLTAARWAAFGATWQQGGRIALSDPLRLDEATLQVENADGAGLAAAAQTLFGPLPAMPNVDGAVAINATASGVIGGELSGHVEVNLPTGTATWPPARGTAPLSVAADVAIDGTTVSIGSGMAKAAQMTAKDLTATDFRAGFSYANGALVLKEVVAQAFDGTWTAAGTVPFNGGPAVGTLRASGVNAGRLARAVLSGHTAGYAASGTVDMTATLTGKDDGQLSLRLASPTMTLDRLRIDAPASARAVLRREAGRIRVADGQAELGGLQIDAVAVRGVRTAFSSDGEAVHVGPLTARALGGTWTISADAARAAVRGTVQARSIDLNRLFAAAGEVSQASRARGDLQVRFERPRGGEVGGSVGLTLNQGRALWRRLIVDAPAKASADFQRGGGLTIRNATATAAAAAYGPLRGTGVNAAFGVADSQLHFSDLHFTSCGGQWQYDGSVGLDQPSPFSGTLAVTGADPRAVLAMMGADGSAVEIEAGDLNGHFTGQLTDDWQQALAGSGRLSLRGGSIPSSELLTAVLDAMSPSRHASVKSQRANRLIELTQTFTVAGALIRTEDLQLQTHDYTLSGAGAVGFDQHLDLTTQVTLTARGIQAMLSLGAIPLPTGVLPSLPPVPTRITGTLADPSVQATAIDLPLVTVKWLADAILGTPARIGGAIIHPLQGLFGGVRDLVGAPPTPTPSP